MDTFPIGTILLVADFVEIYTLQLQNEIQSQYYHSDQVSIMVHITYRHEIDSIEEKIVIMEYHFYISDGRCHDLDFVQHIFQLFYNHLKDNNIQMEQHWIWSHCCAGKFKNCIAFNGCVFSTRGTRCHIFGTILRPDMEKGNMMEQVHALRLHYVGKR